MKSIEIRKKFFTFFTKHGHKQINSSSLIPAQDPTLLFTNAGMNQFKDLFLGNEKQSYTTAVTIQKCVRAGGKHNDLDNVGFTRRHLTFFEMMGNFSFGDYFKKEAIAYAWNFLTQDLGMDPKNMFVSVYEQDDEAFAIWNEQMGIPKERIFRFGKKDNFWQMGNTGPCGPCTEIYVDQRPEADRATAPTYEDFDQGRLLEIWNLVFMQFNLQEDGSLEPLKQTGVDTGMGLERVTCVMQGVDSVYKTDIFLPIITAIEKLTGVTYADQDEKTKAAFHVLCDHIRSTSLIIADGGTPSNEGRGYVLRKIIRRAALFAQKLTSKNIFPDLAKAFIKEMSPIYPELKTNETMIVNLLHNEIEQFAQNLIRGQGILQDFFSQQTSSKQITGEQAFKLYDTYGFPVEVTYVAAQERGFSVDFEGFEVAMNKQRQLSGKKMKEQFKQIELPETVTTTFVGYEKTAVSSPIIGLLVDDQLVNEVKQGTPVWVITKECPFFVTTGGQVDDQGFVSSKGKRASLEGLRKIGKAIAFLVTAPDNLKINDVLEQQVELSTRIMTMNNHTATHLLQAALIQLLGKQVKQAGSVVDPEYLRFDFTFHRNLTEEEIRQVETIINDKIRENIGVQVFNTTYKEALEKGVIAIFGEKYNPENVRVVDVPGFSAELCGGTHVPFTGVIGLCKITDVTAVSAGVRRIFAVTGPKAIELFQKNFNSIKELSQEFKVKPEEVMDAVEKQKCTLRESQTQIKSLKQELVKAHLPAWLTKVTTVKSLPFLYLVIDNQSVEDLREMNNLLQSQKPGFYFLVSNKDGKAAFYASLDNHYESTFDLAAFSTWLKSTTGLFGGGKKGTIQGGGPATTAATEKQIKEYVSAH